jgi:hypothetical protein
MKNTFNVKKIISIRLAVIEDRYGRGNFDDAGDDLWACLSEVSDFNGQHSAEFLFDNSHVNHYFHTLNFVINNIDEEKYSRFMEKVMALGLIE